jgi:phospholipid-binding lipoprotein MlaA
MRFTADPSMVSSKTHPRPQPRGHSFSFCALMLSAAFAMLAGLGGCASLPAGHVKDERDPWERYNRAVYTFNDTLDRNLIKPAAEIYRDYVPEVFQLLVRNFFGNLADVSTSIHHLLQGKPSEAGESAARVLFNTTLGFAGLGDPASEMGFAKTSEDFGQTLAVWGARPGPYFMLPLLGPSTVRDSFGTVADMRLDPVDGVIPSGDGRIAAFTLIALDRRKTLLGAEGTLDALSFDRYSGLRDAFLARRRSQVYDGDPPPISNEED